MSKNTSSKQPQASPANGLWLRFIALIPVAVVLGLIAFFYIRSVCSTYQAWTPVYMQQINFESYDLGDLRFSNPGIVEATEVEHFPTGAARVTFHALQDGETDVEFGTPTDYVFWHLDVRDGAIIEGNINFSGWKSIHLCVCVFLAITCALFASALVRLVKTQWYGYEMVACGGALAFCLFQLAFFIFLYMHKSLLTYSDMACALGEMAGWFLGVTFIPFAVMALLVSISNISLIRHEGRRPVNLLGIAVSFVWAAANYGWYRWWTYGEKLGLSITMQQLINCLIEVALTFGECLLLSTIVCAWLASRHVPKHNTDYLIVLGCGLRKDGTPCPLLAGRVDRARSFDEARVAAGEAPATFVPSGGQGPDEVMSEAQSMATYLQGKGVPQNRIVLEDRSSTTRENMAYSREVIEAHAHKDVSEVTVGFSTTNYHVFRGYVCAHEAGMAVEGMGSKTKAYFWPNAFLREFAGLLASQWKGILQTFVIIGAIYALAEYALILT